MQLPLILTQDMEFEDERVRFYINKNDTCIGAWLNSGQIWEKFMIPYFKRYIKPGSTIIDIGANIGTHTVYFGKLFKDCEIKSFEPVPWLYEVLTKNLNVNNITNCTTYNMGLGAIESILYTTPEVNKITENLNFGAYGLSDQKQGDLSKIVKIDTLDSFNFQNVSFIKIDTEGNEFDILKGAMKTIALFKPTMVIEIFPHSFENFNLNLAPEFIKLGYKWNSISPHHDYLFTISE